jgi:hypothetical protein
LKISHRVVDPNIQVVAVSGRFTIGEESQEAERIMDTLVAQKERRFVFDLLEVDFIDSSGIGFLVRLHAKAQRAGGAELGPGLPPLPPGGGGTGGLPRLSILTAGHSVLSGVSRLGWERARTWSGPLCSGHGAGKGTEATATGRRRPIRGLAPLTEDRRYRQMPGE